LSGNKAMVAAATIGIMNCSFFIFQDTKLIE
jgi:hypothetical protein